MTKQANQNSEQQPELTNSWDQQLQRLNARLRASGRTVTVMEPSDTNEFVVTFPQAKLASAEPSDES